MTALVAVAMAVGLVGVLVPVVPGLVLVWAAGLAYGFVEGFSGAGLVAVVAMTALLAAATVAKVVLPARRAEAGGAARSSLLVGGVLGLVGFFVVPVVGLVLGMVGGVLLAEYARAQAWAPAWDATKAVLVGYGIATALELAAGVAMVGCWVVWVLVD